VISSSADLIVQVQHSGLHLISCKSQLINQIQVYEVLIKADRSMTAIVYAVETLLSEPQHIASLVHSRAAGQVTLTIIMQNAS